jgi:two-component system, NarL family, nitrate/nitrite response regulator NarL
VQQSSVVVVSFQPIFLQGMLATLAGDPAITVRGSSLCPLEAPKLAARHRPDVVLLKSREPDGGIGTIGRILRSNGAAKVILIARNASIRLAALALAEGAAGCLSSRSSGEELLAATRAVAMGRAYISPLLAEPTGTVEACRQGDRLSTLNVREQQIANYLLRGRTNREIAECLGLREKTVKNYMTQLMQKLDVRNRLELALWLAGPQVLQDGSGKIGSGLSTRHRGEAQSSRGPFDSRVGSGGRIATSDAA